MPYCDYPQYVALGGALTQAQFLRFAPQAAARIDALTLGRAQPAAAQCADALAYANAEMTDILAQSAQAPAASLASTSNDGYAETYRSPAETARALDRALLNALRSALGADPHRLLWQGVG